MTQRGEPCGKADDKGQSEQANSMSVIMGIVDARSLLPQQLVLNTIQSTIDSID